MRFTLSHRGAGFDALFEGVRGFSLFGVYPFTPHGGLTGDFESVAREKRGRFL